MTDESRTSRARRRGRALLGLALAGMLMIPSGIALADQVGKQTPPPVPVTKTTPPPPPGQTAAPDDGAPADGADAPGSPQEAAALPDASAPAPGEQPLDDELSSSDAAAGQQQAPGESAQAAQPDPGTKPSAAEFKAETKGEPASSSAKDVNLPGESLTTLHPEGLEQPKADAEGVDPDGGKASPTATGDIALKGEKAAAKADWVIVGLSAPLSTAANAVNVIGASWDTPRKGVTIKAEMREQIKGKWTAWEGLEPESMGADGGGSAKRTATEPYVSVAASDLQVRLLTSDGSVPANARVELIGDDIKAKDKKVTAGAGVKQASGVPKAQVATAALGSGQAPIFANPLATTAPGDPAGTTSGDTATGDDATGDITGDEIVGGDSGVISADTGLNVVPAAGKALPQPTIRSRASWGARAPKSKWEYGRVNGMVIHHTAGSNNYTAAQVPAILRSIQQYHMKSNGWNDIGYNFLIDKYGVIWEGRAGGITNAIIGAQALNVNSKTSGVSVLGTYSKTPPSQSAINSLVKLTAWKLSLTSVNPRGTMVNLGKRTPAIIGHRDAPGNSTSCPGNAFYAKISSIRSAVATRTPTSFRVQGSGSGNGVGLSQYGAYGLARQNWSGAGIVQHYFSPAKVSYWKNNPNLKVQLLKSSRMITVTRHAGTMQLVAGSKKYTAKKIQFKYRGGRILAVVGKKTYRAPGNAFQVRWSGTSYLKGKAGVVSVTRAANNTGTVRYRYGRLLITKISGKMNVVNQLRLSNEYLYGVSEVPSSWPKAAMTAQAIASRTVAMKAYYERQGRTRADCNCHLYDEARTNSRLNSQVFRGWSKGGQATWGVKWRSAVNASDKSTGSRIDRGGVMTLGGKLIDIRWTPSTGGKTMPAADGIGRTWARSYLSSRNDPAVKNGANPYRSWSRTLSPTQIAKAFGLKSVVRVDVINKSVSGGVTGLQATASDGKIAKMWGPENIRRKFGLPSAYFSISG